MDINVLKNFLVLAENLSFTKSSDQVFIAQPALSRQIKQLEESLHAQLFKRNKRNVNLTPAGVYFRCEVQRIVNQYDHAVKMTSRLHKGEAGEIRIGYTHSAMQSFVPSLIRHINKVLPDIHTVLLELSNNRQAELLKNKEIDIGFSTNPIVGEKIKSRLMVKENFAVVLPLDHEVNQQNFKDFSVFAGAPFILPPKAECATYVGILESIFRDAGLTPNLAHETAHAGTGIRMVETGMGLTIEPLSGIKKYANIKYVELKDIPQKAELTMLWHPELETEAPRVVELLMNFEIQDS
jgi:DNA-binding transcriptional LysR family regulator